MDSDKSVAGAEVLDTCVAIDSLPATTDPPAGGGPVPVAMEAANKFPGSPYQPGPMAPPPYTPRRTDPEHRNVIYSQPDNPQQYWITSDPRQNGGQPPLNFVQETFANDFVRRKFVAKVYSILALQFLVTTGFVLVFTLSDEVQEFADDYWWLIFVFTGLFMVPYFILVCVEKARRSFPINIILLSVLTIAQSFVAGITTTVYETNVVLYAMASTCAICFTVSIAAIFCPIDVTACGKICCMMAMFLCIFSLVTMITMLFVTVPLLHLVFCGFGVLCFSMFMLYDTQMIMGGRRIELSPEEYILAVIQLYVDYIMIFYYMLPLVGACCEE